MGLTSAPVLLKIVDTSKRSASPRAFRRRATWAVAPALFLGALVPVCAHADVVISSAATANMSCSGGICAPTAKDAVLNVGDLETLLASSNVEVTTTGSDVQAGNIAVEAPLTWSSTNTLALDAQETTLIEKPVSVTGPGGLSVTTDDGGKSGYFGFQGKGQVAFASLSSALTINGAAYTLAGSIATLAADVAANSAGNYALANDYDAANDGTYSNSPIPTQFSGAFEGLGNTISNLSLNGTDNANDPIGLFAELALNNGPGGSIENINLTNVTVGGSGLFVGGLTGINFGMISGVFVSGSLSATFSQGSPNIGSIAGVSDAGIIARSSAMTTIVADEGESGAGGLVGLSAGAISQSFAQCKVTGVAGTYLGELVGNNFGPITESYAGGVITGGEEAEIGGLVGLNFEESTISQSYSTAAMKGVNRNDRDAGGLIGVDYSPAKSNASDYWDISTSHIKGRERGAGTPKNDPGIKGRTTEQLEAALPVGFDSKVWAENPKINKGFPYLISNPPR